MMDNDDLNDIYGPQRWYGLEADSGGVKKALLLDLQSLIFLVDLGLTEREKAFPPKALGK